MGSWEYPTNFLVINPKIRLDGHPLILGRPCLATVDAYIGCLTGSMTIAKGDAINNIAIYPPTKQSLPTVDIHKQPHTYWEQNVCSPLTIVEALEFKYQTKDDVINNFMNQPYTSGNLKCQMLKLVIDNEAQEDPLVDIDDQHIPMTVVRNNMPIEMKP